MTSRELSRNSDVIMHNAVVPSNSFLDFLAKNQDFNKVSIKSLSYDEHKFAKIRCLYGRRVTLNLKQQDEYGDNPEGSDNPKVESVVVQSEDIQKDDNYDQDLPPDATSIHKLLIHPDKSWK